jgi:hypothetical protein
MMYIAWGRRSYYRLPRFAQVDAGIYAQHSSAMLTWPSGGKERREKTRQTGITRRGGVLAFSEFNNQCDCRRWPGGGK